MYGVTKADLAVREECLTASLPAAEWSSGSEPLSRRLFCLLPSASGCSPPSHAPLPTDTHTAPEQWHTSQTTEHRLSPHYLDAVEHNYIVCL